MKHILKVVCMTSIAMLCLTACQNTLQSSSVTSKNDGSFDANIAIEASESHAPDSTSTIKYEEIFYSTDNSVEFQIDIDKNIATPDMPIVQVRPHYFTEQEVQRIAESLFGQADFFDARPSRSTEFTKSEILKKIERWAKYVDNALICELYGRNAEHIADLVSRYIEKYTLMAESAPEGTRDDRSQWKYKKATYYIWPESEISKEDTVEDNDEIQVDVITEHIPYRFTAAVRDKSDYKLSLISAYPYDGASPGGIDGDIFRAWLCRTNEPTQTQTNFIKEKAERMLNEMGLGSWLVDQCYVETNYYGDIPEYIVHVNATPLLCTAPVSRHAQLTNLKSPQVYASSLYLSDVNFQFSADGNLVKFEMYTPLDIVEVANPNVEVMSFDTLFERAKDSLRLSDANSYGIDNLENLTEEVICTVKITDFDYGLSRVKVPDTDDSYYYVPSFTLKGNVELTGVDTGNLYSISSVPITLLTLNAVDGSILHTSNW